MDTYMSDKDHKEEFLIEYVERFVPDIPTLARYIKLAKGPDRTMEEFAKECNVSGSTLSRIANGKITRRISKDLAKAIIENSANKNLFDYRMLMRANGMVPANSHSEQRVSEEPETAEWYYGEKNTLNTVKNVMSDELSRRDYMFNFGRVPMTAGRMIRRINFMRRGDFTVRVQGFEPANWNFYIDYDPVYRGEESRRSWVKDWSEVFLTDIWAKEQFEGAKSSFVFINEETYADFISFISDRKVNTDMSAIYINVEESKLIAETILPKNSGKALPSLLEKPAQSEEEYLYL